MSILNNIFDTHLIQKVLGKNIIICSFHLEMHPSARYLLPYSNIEIILLANMESFSSTAFDGQLFGFIPIANKTILEHIIDQFRTCNFYKMSIVCREEDYSSFETFQTIHLSQSDEENINSQIKLIPVDRNMKTCDIIRKIVQNRTSNQENLPGHFLIYPLNLFTSVNMEDVIDFHLSNKAKITLFASTLEQGIKEKERRGSPGYNMSNYSFEGPKGKRFIVYDESKKDQLVQLLSNSDALKEDNDINLDTESQDEFQNMKMDSHLLKKYPTLSIDMSVNLTGAYILSPEIIDFLMSHPEINSIESELIPLVCLENGMSKINSSVFLFRIKNNEDFAFRINDFISYFVANMRIATGALKGYLPQNDQIMAAAEKKKQTKFFRNNPQRKLPPGFVFSPNNVYGKYLSSATLDPQIQRTVIGENCTLGKDVKIISTVIHDHVVIEDGVELRNCIVCSKATISTNSQLVHCIVMPEYKSEKGFKCEGCVVQNKQ